MLSPNPKVLRGQLRQIVKEALTEELVSQLEDRLIRFLLVKVEAMEQKQKDILGFVVRNNSLSSVIKK